MSNPKIKLIETLFEDVKLYLVNDTTEDLRCIRIVYKNNKEYKLSSYEAKKIAERSSFLNRKYA